MCDLDYRVPVILTGSPLCLSNARRVQSCEEEEEVVQETEFLDRHNLTIKGYFS